MGVLFNNINNVGVKKIILELDFFFNNNISYL